MKKLLSMILCLLMIVMSFSACKEEPKGPVTITIMTEGDITTWEYYLEEKVSAFYGDQIQLRFEKLQSDQRLSVEERENELQRVRAGIMAGDGPDIYFLPTVTPMLMEGVFPNVPEAMNNGIFLPLDEYIEDSEVFSAEDYIRPIFEAGRTQRGQMVVPLLYDLPMVIVDKSLTDKLGRNTITLDELLVCGDDAALSRSASTISFDRTSYFFPELADYSTGNLNLTQEELRNYFDDISAVTRKANEIENFEYHAYYELSEEYNIFMNFSEYTLSDLSKYSEELAPLIITNNDGKYTAKITAFAAIGANTEHPEEAFKVLEIICGGYKTFEQDVFRANIDNMCANKGISTLKEAYGEKDLIDIELIKILEDSVAAAEFQCDIDNVISRGRSIYASAVKNGDIEEAEKALSETYTELKMHLAE